MSHCSKNFNDQVSTHTLPIKPSEMKNTCSTQGSEDENNELLFRFEIDEQVILDIFDEVVEKMKFDPIEREQRSAMAVKQSKRSIFNLMNCFRCFNKESYTAVKIEIGKTKKSNRKIGRLYGLAGQKRQIQLFCQQFHKLSNHYQIKENFIYQFQRIQNQPQTSNPYLDQNNQTYLINRFLANQNTLIGQIVINGIINIRLQINSINQKYSQLPKIIQILKKLIQKTTIQLSKQIDNQVQEAFIQLAVERYIFDRISDQLFSIYLEKDRLSQQTFLVKKANIFEMLTSEELFNEICLDSRMRFISAEQINKKTNISQLKKSMGLQNICLQFQRISLCSNPREKAKFCESMFAMLKNYVSNKSNSKIQLKNMQDIIPFTILILLMSNINNIRAQLNIIIDFFNEQDNDSVERHMINLSESFNFVQKNLHI